jgi:hypothetical protein
MILYQKKKILEIYIHFLNIFLNKNTKIMTQNFEILKMYKLNNCLS